MFASAITGVPSNWRTVFGSLAYLPSAVCLFGYLSGPGDRLAGSRPHAYSYPAQSDAAGMGYHSPDFLWESDRGEPGPARLTPTPVCHLSDSWVTEGKGLQLGIGLSFGGGGASHGACRG